MIYLNNAATSQHKPECVIEAVTQAMREYGSAARGANVSSLEPSRMVTALRAEIAGLFGFSYPERVVFTMNATQALNTVLFGLFRPGDHVIATDLDHNAVLRPLYELRKQSVAADFVPADRRGCIDIRGFERLIRPETKAIVCTHASNLTGNVLDIEAIAAVARQHRILFILDASQTAGAFPIDMEKTGIDILCFTGHKSLLGPQGTGGLLVRPGIGIRPLIMGGTGIRSFEDTQPEAYPEHLEAGTLNSHGLAGLLAAVRFIRETGIKTIHDRESALARQFCQGVREIPGTVLYGDFPADFRQRAPIAAMNIAGMDSSEFADILSADYDIQVRAGGHCAPRMHRALGTDKTGAVRFSFGYYNTPEEVAAAVQAVREIAEEAGRC